MTDEEEESFFSLLPNKIYKVLVVFRSKVTATANRHNVTVACGRIP